MATGLNWSGLRMIVPNSHYPRALRKPSKQNQEESLALWSTRLRVRASGEASPFSNRVKIYLFHVPNPACCDLCESVICMELSLQNKDLEQTWKKFIQSNIDLEGNFWDFSGLFCFSECQDFFPSCFPMFDQPPQWIILPKWKLFNGWKKKVKFGQMSTLGKCQL